MSYHPDAAFAMLQICTFCDSHLGFFAHSQWIKAINIVLVFNKFENGFAHINFNDKDGHEFAKKFSNVQTSTLQ